MIENVSISLILDGVIVVLLVATIIYAARLSLYLKKFKDSRADLEGIVKDLSKHITRADEAVHALNETVEMSGEDLQVRMDKAQAMFDELDLVVQTGDSLANRLEELATRNRKIIDGHDGDVADLARVHLKTSEYDDRLEDIVKTVDQDKGQADAAVSSSPFMIRDPELERNELETEAGFTLDDNEVLSEAERDLYEALEKKKKSRGR